MNLSLGANFVSPSYTLKKTKITAFTHIFQNNNNNNNKILLTNLTKLACDAVCDVRLSEYSALSLYVYVNSVIILNCKYMCRSQWPWGLRRTSAAAGLLGLWVRIPTGAWMFVCCECCVMSGRGL